MTGCSILIPVSESPFAEFFPHSLPLKLFHACMLVLTLGEKSGRMADNISIIKAEQEVRVCLSECEYSVEASGSLFALIEVKNKCIVEHRVF